MRKAVGPILLLLLLVACSPAKPQPVAEGVGQAPTDSEVADGGSGSSAVIEIKENLFIAQLDDLYLNLSDYVGRTVQLEGFVDIIEIDGLLHYGVVRQAMVCCAADMMLVGLEFNWDGEPPKQNDWVAVRGILQIDADTETGEEYPVLQLESLVVKQERGSEIVYQ